MQNCAQLNGAILVWNSKIGSVKWTKDQCASAIKATFTVQNFMRFTCLLLFFICQSHLRLNLLISHLIWLTACDISLSGLALLKLENDDGNAAGINVVDLW